MLFLHPFFTLLQTFLELRLDSPEFRDPGQCVYVPRMSTPCNASFCEVPVQLPKSKFTVSSYVSPEDYDRITSIASVWHINSSGYVVSSTRKNGVFQTMYMHKLVAGCAAKHVNGDKLDCRRHNLIPSSRGRKRISDISTDDLYISTVSPVLDHVYSPDEIQLDWVSDHTSIDYGEGKTYCGAIFCGKPHGFGTLVETKEWKRSIGWWLNGEFTNGVVSYLVPVPLILQEAALVPQVKAAFLVHNRQCFFPNSNE